MIRFDTRPAVVVTAILAHLVLAISLLWGPANLESSAAAPFNDIAAAESLDGATYMIATGNNSGADGG